MKNKYIVLIAIVLCGFNASSQVKDLSFTFSPAAEYTWMNDKAGFNDALFVGGKLGFGFGEYLELRGVYLQSLGLTTNFENFGLPNFNASLIESQDAKLTRWGGEFKANIGTKKLMPFLTLGTGIQNIEFDSNDFEQIYASAGLGIKFNMGNRAVITIEGKNTMYNFNTVTSLLTGTDKATLNIRDADYSNEKLNNWSVLGSLQFYLGGRKPGSLTELDEAYLKKFKGGFRGMQLIIEPSVAHISFDDKSLFNDSYFLGGYAGFDFNEYIGLRGFYFKSTKNDEISTDFDELSMYGVEFRARLNDGNGVTPYLILGGGYLKSNDLYVGKGNVTVAGGEFAEGGLGLNIPLGRRVLISGGLRAMITSGEDVENISAPNEIQTHLMYNAGIKFSIGRKSKAPNEIVEKQLKDASVKQAENNEAKIQKLKGDYETKLNDLEADIAKAYEKKDVNKAVLLLEEKKETQKALQEVEKIAAVQQESNGGQNLDQSTIIQMTPAEFETLIDRILKGVNGVPNSKVTSEEISIQEKETTELEAINARIDGLEKLIKGEAVKPIIEEKEAVKSDKKAAKKETEAVNSKISSADKKEITTVTEVETAAVDKKEVKSSKEEVNNEVELSSIDEKELKKAAKKAAKEAKEEKVAAAKIEKKLAELNDKVDENTEAIENELEKKQAVAVEEVAIDSLQNNSLIDVTKTVDSVSIIMADEEVTKDKFLKYQNSSIEAGYQFSNSGYAVVGAKAYFGMGSSIIQFVPEVFVGLSDKTIFGVSGNFVLPIRLNSDYVQPYIGAGAGGLNSGSTFKGFYNAIVGTHLPFISENMYVDYTMRNTFDYNQISIGYKLPF